MKFNLARWTWPDPTFCDEFSPQLSRFLLDWLFALPRLALRVSSAFNALSLSGYLMSQATSFITSLFSDVFPSIRTRTLEEKSRTDWHVQCQLIRSVDALARWRCFAFLTLIVRSSRIYKLRVERFCDGDLLWDYPVPVVLSNDEKQMKKKLTKPQKSTEIDVIVSWLPR